MSTMKNYSGSFLCRLVLPGLVALLVLLSPALVRADAITTFDVSATAKNVSGGPLGSCASGATCPVSGMFKVDTTTGTVESSGFDITFPGFGAVDSFTASFSNFPFWQIQNTKSQLFLLFTTAPTAGSLVGFTGGTIDNFDSALIHLYLNLSGSITPVSTIITPEPSSLVLFASGMLVLGLARRFGKKVGHSLSA